MPNGSVTDSNGNFHGDDGRFVSLRDYIERILSEKDLSAEFKRVSLELALNEAKSNIAKELGKAKEAADNVSAELKSRLDKLESGGAPFASRLDQSLTELKDDVETLNEGAVKATVLDALRKQDVEDKKKMRRAIWGALATGGAALLIAVIRILTELVG